MFDKIQEIKGSDDNVIKYVFETTGDSPAIFEAVLYKYPTYEERTVMCVSSQSGCPMGCTFCGTGKFFNRNATGDEILEQVGYMAAKNNIALRDVEKLQIMVMSMGEPVLNAENLDHAFANIYEAVPNAQLLISTAAPRSDLGWKIIMKMCERIPTIGLQFSVHDSTNEARDLIMPMRAKLTLEQIAEKGVEFYERTGRRPFFNYCAHAGNATEADAARLATMFNPEIWEATISVICEADETMADAVQNQEDMVNGFSGMLVERGFNTRVFNPAGQDDIGGGCGQLWQVQKWAEENPELMKQSAGNKCLERRNDS
jgi:23S rRNA (adenine2503-C2)-methyltransferase